MLAYLLNFCDRSPTPWWSGRLPGLGFATQQPGNCCSRAGNAISAHGGTARPFQLFHECMWKQSAPNVEKQSTDGTCARLRCSALEIAAIECRLKAKKRARKPAPMRLEAVLRVKLNHAGVRQCRSHRHDAEDGTQSRRRRSALVVVRRDGFGGVIHVVVHRVRTGAGECQQ